MEDKRKIAYLCDGKKPDCTGKDCYLKNENGICKYTSDVRHAKNFEKVRGVWAEKPPQK